MRLALEGLFHGLTQDRIDEVQHLAVGRLAALRDHVLVHVVAIGAHRLDALGIDDDGVGMGGGELAAARRAAGLGDDRLALRRRPRIQRPARAEVLAAVIDGVDLGVIDQHATLAIGDDRAGLPRAPQATADFHVFVGHVVAQVMLGHALHAEVHRREVRTAGDGVPADASAGHLVERRHQAGQQIGVIGVGAEGRNDADARRHLASSAPPPPRGPGAARRWRSSGRSRSSRRNSPRHRTNPRAGCSRSRRAPGCVPCSGTVRASSRSGRYARSTAHPRPARSILARTTRDETV